jgi:putative membrane protein
MTTKTTWLAVAVASGTLALAGCQSEGRSDVPPSAMAAASAAPTGRLDDATKTNILLRQIHSANQDEIDMGKLAVDRAQSAEVKRFASEMVNDHTSADQKLTDLAKRMNVDITTPPQDPVQAALVAASEEKKRTLKGMSGMQFEVAYIAPQVDMHDLVLKFVEEGQKSASGDAKKLFEEIRPTIESHRDHAKNLMRGLSFSPAAVGGGPSGGDGAPSGSAGGMKADAGAGSSRHDGGHTGSKPNP